MQVQVNIAAPGATAAQAPGGAAGNNAGAGDASFSRLLGQAAPREPAQGGPSPHAQPTPAREADRQACRRSEAAQHGERPSAQDGDAHSDDGPDAPADTPAVINAAVDDASVAAPGIVPADPSLATWLATFVATLAPSNDVQPAPAGGLALIEPQASRTALPPAVNATPFMAPLATPAPGAGPAAEHGAADHTPAGTQALESAAGIAQHNALDALRCAEAAAGGPSLRNWRANDLQPLVADTNASAVAASLATGSAPVAGMATPAVAAPSAAATLQLRQPVGGPEFAPTLALTLTRLARDGVQEARLQLHPAEMGPIDVRIAVDGTQARIDFSADIAATRSAIEAGLPQLASALRESGLTLAGGSVFQHARGQHEPGAGNGSARAESGGDEADTSAVAPAPWRVTRGVVDLYA